MFRSYYNLSVKTLHTGISKFESKTLPGVPYKELVSLTPSLSSTAEQK